MTPAARKGTALIGWQTLLADLSLILFMVTAAAMAANPHRGGRVKSAINPVPATPIGPSALSQGEPIALWRTGGSLTLRRWLASEQPDARQQLTITARYGKGSAAQALKDVQALVGEAGTMGRDVRVIVTPAANASGVDTRVSLAYDQAP